jgi:hypothetical protein
MRHQTPTADRYLVLSAILLACLSGAVRAEHRTTNVPPTLEIEVLDPNADALGRPAIELGRDEFGNVIVDIPPVVLVHRYYFSGERSFQAQLLPGGPSIVVLNHPKTGERQYIDVQMPPGAPRVTYTAHGIEYDFGETGVSIVFGLFGHPSVEYRSGRTLGRTVKGHFDKLFASDISKARAEEARAQRKQSAERNAMIAYGAAANVSETVGKMLLPARNALEMMPLGKVIFFDPTTEDKLIQTAVDHKREKENARLEKQRQYEEMTRKTIR